MAQNYPEQLAQWIERRGLTPADKNLIAFMTVHDDVKMAMEAGYAIKTIWTHLKETGRIDLSYKTFLNYVRRVLGPVPGRGAVSEDKPPSSAPSSVQAAPPSGDAAAPVRVMPLPMPGFTYNPVPNKEELL